MKKPSLLSDEGGQALSEYVLIFSVIILVVLVAVSLFADEVTRIYSFITQTLMSVF